MRELRNENTLAAFLKASKQYEKTFDKTMNELQKSVLLLYALRNRKKELCESSTAAQS